MANYYRNYLIIHGATDKLQLFKNNALPKDGEQGGNSWGGHGEGALSFLSLCPPSPELRNQKSNSACNEWRAKNWGGLFPELTSGVKDLSLTENALLYPFFMTKYAPSHNFVVSVSRLYPELLFHLIWWDVYEGEYGTPMRFTHLVANGGRTMDYQTSVSCEPMLDGHIQAVIKATKPYVADSIWLGLANRLHHAFAINCPGDRDLKTLAMANRLIWIMTEGFIHSLYRRYRGNTVIKFKDSIKKIIEIPRPTVKKTGCLTKNCGGRLDVH